MSPRLRTIPSSRSARRAGALVLLLALGAGALAFAPAAAPAANASARVIGGAKVGTETYDARWASVVSIGWKGARSAADRHFCGGTLIAPTIVLTARHCVERDLWTGDPSDHIVYGGSPSLVEGGHAVAVREIFRPERSLASPLLRNGDIALLELASPGLDLPVTAIARPEHAGWWGDGAGRAAGIRVAGWGIARDADIRSQRSFGPGQTELRAAALPILSTAACTARVPHDASTIHQICAGTREVRSTAATEGRTACYGDSGGPLLADDPAGVEPPRVVGIVSRGTAMECAGGPTVYTKVAPHAGWIDSVSDYIEQGRDLRAPTATYTAHQVRRGTVRFSRTQELAGSGDRFSIEMRLGTGWMRLGVFKDVAPNRFALPPTRTGALTAVRVRRTSGVGHTQAKQSRIATRIDRRSPSPIARFTARRVGYTHRLAWSSSYDRDDRVAGYAIQQRRAGSRRWQWEAFFECSACWVGRERTSSTQRSTHVLLPGRRQFRVAAVDRAGNWSRWTISR